MKVLGLIPGIKLFSLIFPLNFFATPTLDVPILLPPSTTISSRLKKIGLLFLTHCHSLLKAPVAGKWGTSGFPSLVSFLSHIINLPFPVQLYSSFQLILSWTLVQAAQTLQQTVFPSLFPILLLHLESTFQYETGALRLQWWQKKSGSRTNLASSCWPPRGSLQCRRCSPTRCLSSWHRCHCPCPALGPNGLKKIGSDET